MALSEKTYIKLTLGTLIFVLMFIIGWTVSATTWKVNIETSVNSNTMDIRRIDIAQHLDAQIAAEQSEIIIQMSTDVSWMKKYMEKKEH